MARYRYYKHFYTELYIHNVIKHNKFLKIVEFYQIPPFFKKEKPYEGFMQPTMNRFHSRNL